MSQIDRDLLCDMSVIVKHFSNGNAEVGYFVLVIYMQSVIYIFFNQDVIGPEGVCDP